MMVTGRQVGRQIGVVGCSGGGEGRKPDWVQEKKAAAMCYDTRPRTEAEECV